MFTNILGFIKCTMQNQLYKITVIMNFCFNAIVLCSLFTDLFPS